MHTPSISISDLCADPKTTPAVDVDLIYDSKGLFSAKYSCESAFITAREGLLVASDLQAD